MKTMCPPGYHHNSFVATHALGHMGLYILKLLYTGCSTKDTRVKSGKSK